MKKIFVAFEYKIVPTLDIKTICVELLGDQDIIEVEYLEDNFFRDFTGENIYANFIRGRADGVLEFHIDVGLEALKYSLSLMGRDSGGAIFGNRTLLDYNFDTFEELRRAMKEGIEFPSVGKNDLIVPFGQRLQKLSEVRERF